MTEEIAGYLGVELGDHTKRVSRLACAGEFTRSLLPGRVFGNEIPCRAAALVSGGGKGCTWGCLGLGDCEKKCEFDAIQMNKHGLPVVDEERCVACNDCVEVSKKICFRSTCHPQLVGGMQRAFPRVMRLSMSARLSCTGWVAV